MVVEMGPLKGLMMGPKTDTLREMSMGQMKGFWRGH